jgi:multidrug efflux pump subunit AcrA (membrane-fusion protein)
MSDNAAPSERPVRNSRGDTVAERILGATSAASLSAQRGTLIRSWIEMKTVLVIALALWTLVANRSETWGQEIEIRNLPLQLIDDVKVASLDTGVVTKLHVQTGDYVAEGAVLMELDRELHEGESAIKKMTCLIADAEAGNDVNLRFSEKTLMLNEKILEKSLNAIAAYPKSISETEIDRLRLERDQSELSIEQAQLGQEVALLTAQLRREEKTLADIQLARRTLRSPLAGIVVGIDAKPGEAVVSGKPTMRIVSLKRLRLIASVDRKFAFKINKGDSAALHIQVGQEEAVVPATIVFVSPEIRFTEQTFDVWAEVENHAGFLLPGMKGTLKMDVRESAKEEPPQPQAGKDLYFLRSRSTSAQTDFHATGWAATRHP